jgi:hypothetical protein
MSSSGGIGARLLDLAALRSPIIDRNLRCSGDAPVSTLLQFAPADGPQPREDFVAAVHKRTVIAYGAHAAAEAASAVRDDPVVTTSNHFGLDTLAVSAHCTLLFALRRAAAPTSVVLGCSSVSMDSGSYPMGLLIYDRCAGADARLVHKLPVWPNRLRRRIVAAAEPVDAGMVARARGRLRAMTTSGEISSFCARAAGRVLDEDLSDDAILSLPTYAQQSTAVNRRLWSRIVGGAPSVIQLELEQVVADLLRHDLTDPGSVVARLMFDPVVRRRLLSALDGVRAGWNLAGLYEALRCRDTDTPPRHGTVFFWGRRDDGRRIPLVVDGQYLVGMDGQRQRCAYPLAPQPLAEAVTSGRLLPSLLTCFTVLSFARGIGCVGGPHQAAYLPIMRDAVARAIAADDPVAAQQVADTPAELCVADLQVALRTTSDGLGLPAGPLEIGEAGGFSTGDLARIGDAVTVREAYLAAFPEVLSDIVPGGLPDGWLDALAAENPRTCPNLVRL